MSKYIFLFTLILSLVSVPAFAARNMNNDKTVDSIKSCSYFQTTSYIKKDTGNIKFKERIQGRVDGGKCRYVMEWYYPSGETKGMVCDLDNEQLMQLYNKKTNQKQNLDGKYFRCSSYELVNGQWEKNGDNVGFSLSE